MSVTAPSPGRFSKLEPARAARAVVLAPIFVYQRLISPAIPRRCKYEPTCSRYAVDAVRRYGAARGLVLAGWRLLRCNPWSHGGYDPVESQRVFGGARGGRAKADADGSDAHPPSDDGASAGTPRSDPTQSSTL